LLASEALPSQGIRENRRTSHDIFAIAAETDSIPWRPVDQVLKSVEWIDDASEWVDLGHADCAVRRVNDEVPLKDQRFACVRVTCCWFPVQSGSPTAAIKGELLQRRRRHDGSVDHLGELTPN
jgi:hypothetical protein